ncbi:MAG: beta/gamma crystallin family protein [bacterium]|nr:beta/gamma crystallin family protein [bacterium]
MRVFGRIDDAYTEKLLPGAIVTLRVGDTELIEHTPSRDGRFAFEIPDETVPIDEDILTCTVEKRGYRTQTSTYRIPEDGDIELAVQLIPYIINWKRILKIVALVLIGLLLLAVLYFGYRILFPPLDPGVTLFEVEPVKIKKGEEAVIKWETVDAEDVVLKWRTVDTGEIITGEKEVEPVGEMIVKPPETRRYRLIIRNELGNRAPYKDEEGETVDYIERELPVKQPPPVILGFAAKPNEIHLWESAVLEWQTAGTETIYILSDPENKSMRIEPKMIHRERSFMYKDYPGAELEDPTPAKKKELNGVIEVFPLETTTFTIVAVNIAGDKREETIKITVLEDPEIISFTTNETTIDLGQSVILRWHTRAAEQVFLNGERTGPRYSSEVYPDGTGPYVLTARNKVGERTRTININVRCPDVGKVPPTLKPPRIDRFHISSTTVAPGAPTMLSWVTDHAEKVYLTIKPVGIQTPPSDTVPESGRDAAAKYKGTDTDVDETRGITPLEGEELEMHGFEPKENVEAVAGEPLDSGRVLRVKPVDSIRVSPMVSTYYELRVVNPLKTVTWTRFVDVQTEPCTVIMYELENYKGESQRFTAGSADIGKLNNRVSSIKIIGNYSVKVFSAPNFEATHQEFKKSIPRLRGTWIGNNAISSFKIINHLGVEK